MVKFTSTMQKPIIHYRPMLKLTEKNIFLANIFFRPGRFWMFSKREMKKWDFFNVWIVVEVVSFNRIYYIYTSFENLENYLEHGKNRIGLSRLYYLRFQIEKNNIGKTGGPLFFANV